MTVCAYPTFEQVKAYGIGVAVAYPPDTDTPGFKIENVGKPEVTRLIGEDAGGLFSPTQASPPEEGSYVLAAVCAARPPAQSTAQVSLRIVPTATYRCLNCRRICCGWVCSALVSCAKQTSGAG